MIFFSAKPEMQQHKACLLTRRGAFENVFHAPSGINEYQGDLIRGDRRWEPTGCVHDFGFRRFTSQKLKAMDRKHGKFMITRGCKGPFIEKGVMTSRPKDEFDEALMDQYHHLFFFTDVTEAKRHFPRVGTNMVIGALCAMMFDFVII